MTRAEARSVPPDPDRARQFLSASRQFVADGERPELSRSSALLIYYQGCVSAMKAILAAAGRDVGGGDAGHLVLIAETVGLLGPAYADLLNRVAEDRRERNAVSYQAVGATAMMVETVRQDASDLLEAAERFVES